MDEDKYLGEAPLLKSVVVSFSLEQKKYKIHESENDAARAEFREFLHWLISTAYQAGAKRWCNIGFVSGMVAGLSIGFIIGKGWL